MGGLVVEPPGQHDVLTAALSRLLFGEREQSSSIPLRSTCVIDHEIVDPRVFRVVEDALDGQADHGDERSLLVQSEQPVVVFIGLSPDERVLGVGPQLPENRDRLLPFFLRL